MQSCDLAVSLSALACCIAEGKSADELALISAILTQLGDTLATLAAQEALCSTSEDDSSITEKNDSKSHTEDTSCSSRKNSSHSHRERASF